MNSDRTAGEGSDSKFGQWFAEYEFGDFTNAKYKS
jgi:hypothetical protein